MPGASKLLYLRREAKDGFVHILNHFYENIAVPSADSGVWPYGFTIDDIFSCVAFFHKIHLIFCAFFATLLVANTNRRKSLPTAVGFLR